MTADPKSPKTRRAERASTPAWAGLRDRLRGGVLPDINTERGTVRLAWDAEQLSDSAFAPPFAPSLGLLPALSCDNPAKPEQVRKAIDELAAILRRQRSLLMAVLHSPDRLLDRIPGLIGEPDTAIGDCWTALCWIAEAAWQCVAEPPSGVRADRLMLPLAARLRFLVLSEPFRHRGKKGDPWLATCEMSQFGEDGLYGRVFGDDSWHELVSRCREARAGWQEELNGFQSRPALALAGPGGIEAELGLLVFRTGRGWRPLVLSGQPLTEPGRITADDRATADDVADRHLLPRFQLARTTFLALVTSPRWWRNPRVPLVVLPPACGAVAVGLAGCGRFSPAAWFALGTYVLIGIGALVTGRAFATPWLLRLPAAASVGLLLLITLPTTWWATPIGGWHAPAALFGTALGYLIIEVRNHAVSAGRAIARAMAVGLAGVLHSLLVCLAGLVLIAPAYVDAKTEKDTSLLRISARFNGTDVSGSWRILILATAFCFAVGVFSQILWEDRPITASLAHSRWRSGR